MGDADRPHNIDAVWHSAAVALRKCEVLRRRAVGGAPPIVIRVAWPGTLFAADARRFGGH